MSSGTTTGGLKVIVTGMVQHFKSVWGFLVIHLSLFWLKLKTTSSNIPTRMKPLPTPPGTHLAMCLYRLTHRFLFLTVGNLFGVAAPTAYCFFFSERLQSPGEKFVWEICFLPRTSQEWSQELQGFLEIWEFPCVGAWDDFHVYVSTALKKLLQLQDKILCN